MNALLSMMVLFSIPFGTLINFFAKKAASFSHMGEDGKTKIKGLHNFGLTKTFFMMMPTVIIMVFFSPTIGEYIEVTYGKVLLVIACVFTASFVTVNTGIIQGIQNFYGLAVIGAGTSAFKFIFAVLFVWFGFGVYGAIGGLLATGLILFLFSQWLINSSLPKNKTTYHISIKDIYTDGGCIFLANSFFAAMTQADVMLVKHYFPPQEAGLYSSAAIMGKAVMYLPSAIVMALFPMVAANQAAGQSSGNLLLKAVILTFALSGTGAFVLLLFPDFIMGILFGTRYVTAAPITAIFGIAMLPMGLVLLLMNYLLAKGRKFFVCYMAIAVILEISGIHFFRDNLKNVLYVIMFSGYLALTPMAISILWQHYRTVGKSKL
jgi:O-antigen/teichoic acid export membrane protein